jgi:sugar phosphate isomerase/epimerase
MEVPALADTKTAAELDIPRRELGRLEALAILDSAVVPAGTGLTAESWPIGAAMLQFPGVTPAGVTVREAGPDYWAGQLRRIQREGFGVVEIPSAWLPIADMSAAERAQLAAVVAGLGMSICATSMVRMSVIDPGAADENLAATHRGIDAAAEVGSPLVCLGLHEALFPEQMAIPWFWTVPGPVNPPDRELWRKAVSRFRELADHGASVGVKISLEVYEGTFLGNCDSAVAFMADIGSDNIGVNPDLGNLIRAQAPIEPWEAMAVKLLPLANYWHVKNYSRAENPPAGTYFTTPTTLPVGLIDYRKAVRYAIAAGFRGAILAENYGGDGLSVSADNARYLRRMLADALDEDIAASGKMDTGG